MPKQGIPIGVQGARARVAGLPQAHTVVLSGVEMNATGIAGQAVTIDVRKWDRISLECNAEFGATWGTAVLEVKRSVGTDTHSSFATAVEITDSDPRVWNIDVSSAASVAIDVTTAEGGALTGTITGYLYNEEARASPALTKAQALRMPAADALFRFLDTVGDGSGTKNATGDYSSGQEEFLIAPAAGEVFVLEQMTISIYDQGSLAPNTYYVGNGLTNGIQVKVKDAGADLLDLTDLVAVKTISDWSNLGARLFEHKNWSSAPTDHVSILWDFAERGYPIVLDGDAGQYLAVELDDDLSGLLEHYFFVQGYKAL